MMSRAISRVAIVVAYIRGLITPLFTTHEPPSTARMQNILGMNTENRVSWAAVL